MSRNESTGRFGLGLNDSNAVTQPPENSGLLQGDFIIGCEGARLGKSRLEDYILLHGEPTIELEVRARGGTTAVSYACLDRGAGLHARPIGCVAYLPPRGAVADGNRERHARFPVRPYPHERLGRRR